MMPTTATWSRRAGRTCGSLLGYDRLDDRGLLDSINALYRDCWELLHNYFLPSEKLEAKSREGAKIKRLHDMPQTPCDRLLAARK